MSMDDFSAYNAIVNQIEAAADHLHDYASKIEKRTRDPIIKALRDEVIKTAQRLDHQALNMTAFYDPIAHGFAAQGRQRDPRREAFQKRPATAWTPPPRVDVKPAIGAAPPLEIEGQTVDQNVPPSDEEQMGS